MMLHNARCERHMNEMRRNINGEGAGQAMERAHLAVRAPQRIRSFGGSAAWSQEWSAKSKLVHENATPRLRAYAPFDDLWMRIDPARLEAQDLQAFEGCCTRESNVGLAC